MILDKEVGQQMDGDGAVVIPFLLPDELNEVRAFFNTIKQKHELRFTNGMHMTLWHSDLAFKKSIQEGLLQILNNAYERAFSNARRLNSIFMVKQAHTSGEFVMHNDWSIVDESKYTSINVWIPLLDTTMHNGALWVIRGSHKIDMPIRGGGALLPDFDPVSDSLREYYTPMLAKAGEAILFFHKTVHGSYANASDTDRVVCTFSVVPKQAPLRICFQKDNTSPLEVYEPADDFNYKYNDLLNDTNTFAPGSKPIASYPPYQKREIKLDDILPFIIKT